MFADKFRDSFNQLKKLYTVEVDESPPPNADKDLECYCGFNKLGSFSLNERI